LLYSATAHVVQKYRSIDDRNAPRQYRGQISLLF
jgi:hypothetical protein